MNGYKNADTFDEQLDEATRWYTLIGGGDANEKDWAAFTVWLEADERNAIAYDKVEDVVNAVSDQASALKTELKEAQIIAANTRLKSVGPSYKPYWKFVAAAAATLSRRYIAVLPPLHARLSLRLWQPAHAHH